MKNLKVTGMAACLVLCGLSMLACENNVANGSGTVVAQPTCITEETISFSVQSVSLCDENEFPGMMDSLVVAHSSVTESEMCNLPETPTLFRTDLQALNRLMPVAELRLTQLAPGACNDYLLAWKHGAGMVALSYWVSHVGVDSIVVTVVKGNETPQQDQELQEFFAIEVCGDSLNLNATVVVDTAQYSAEASNESCLWLRSDLNEAREQYIAECTRTEKNYYATNPTAASALLQGKTPEEYCTWNADMVSMEKRGYACKYDANESSPAITCSFTDGCSVE